MSCGALLRFGRQEPRAGHGLPRLRGARCSAGRKLPRGKVSRACRRMGHGKERLPAPDAGRRGNAEKVWWKCPKGHSYFASVASRVRGSGCPACGGKTVVPGENDLATQYPLLAAQWDAAKNGALTPETVLPGSNRRVWWRCEDGHSYPAAISHRVRSGSDCPFCANRKVLPGFNDLAAIEPAVASQWHPTRNGSLTPQQVTPGSSRRVWWLCENGHAWRAVVSSRTGKQRCGCPICAGRPLDRCTAILSEPPAEPVKISAQTAGSRRKHIL